jgi:hypothetical protein
VSNAAFKRNFSALLRRVGDKAELVTRKTIIEIFVQLVQKSPVDTGRFRANWVVGNGAINAFTTTATDKGGSGAIANASAAIMNGRIGQTFYLTNSLPYAGPLEYGHSKQAPTGMVRTTVREYTQHLRRVVRGMR